MRRPAARCAAGAAARPAPGELAARPRGGAGRARPAHVPAWQAAATDAERLRVVIDQVAQLTDSSASPGTNASSADSADRFRRASLRQSRTILPGRGPRRTPRAHRLAARGRADPGRGHRTRPREVAHRRRHRRARPAAQRRRRQPQGHLPVPRREVAFAVGVPGAGPVPLLRLPGRWRRHQVRPADRPPRLLATPSSGWPGAAASSCATSRAAARRPATTASGQRLVDAHREARDVLRASSWRTAEARAGPRRSCSRAASTPSVAERFGCGYAPSTWDALTRHLLAKGFTPAELTLGGLSRESGRGVADRPVPPPAALADPRRRPATYVGFGARRLFDDDRVEAKYLNTPETPIYKKSQLLYGVDLAKKEIARQHRAVIVEGYTDVMACHLAGVTTAVATCGTAFGTEHVGVVRRLLMDSDAFTGEVIFTFDGDAAGMKAAERAFADDQKFMAQTFVAIEATGMDPVRAAPEVRRHRGARPGRAPDPARRVRPARDGRPLRPRHRRGPRRRRWTGASRWSPRSRTTGCATSTPAAWPGWSGSTTRCGWSRGCAAWSGRMRSGRRAISARPPRRRRPRRSRRRSTRRSPPSSARRSRSRCNCRPWPGRSSTRCPRRRSSSRRTARCARRSPTPGGTAAAVTRAGLDAGRPGATRRRAAAQRRARTGRRAAAAPAPTRRTATPTRSWRGMHEIVAARQIAVLKSRLQRHQPGRAGRRARPAVR